MANHMDSDFIGARRVIRLAENEAEKECITFTPQKQSDII